MVETCIPLAALLITAQYAGSSTAVDGTGSGGRHRRTSSKAFCYVAEVVPSKKYSVDTVLPKLERLLSDKSYSINARKVALQMDHEDGTNTACDIIERALDDAGRVKAYDTSEIFSTVKGTSCQHVQQKQNGKATWPRAGEI